MVNETWAISAGSKSWPTAVLEIALGCSSSPATLLKLCECQTVLIFLYVWREWKAETWTSKSMMLWVDSSSDLSSLMPNTKGLTSRRLRCINTLEDHNPSEWTCTHRHELVGRSEKPFYLLSPIQPALLLWSWEAPKKFFSKLQHFTSLLNATARSLMVLSI